MHRTGRIDGWNEDLSDGQGPEHRQIGVASSRSSAHAYTGAMANGYAGHRADGSVSVQGNGLASDEVLAAMWDRFHDSDDSPLAERLLSALEARQAAGGQTIGVLSAALIVATPSGWPIDTDLRVDFAPATAIEDLRAAYDANVARQLLFRSERAIARGDTASANRMVDEALDRAPGWDRIWLRAARIAKKLSDDDSTRRRICHFRQLNPVWADQLDGEFDFGNCGQ